MSQLNDDEKNKLVEENKQEVEGEFEDVNIPNEDVVIREDINEEDDRIPVDVMDEGLRGNFIPLLIAHEKGIKFDLKVAGSTGYNMVSTAIAFANMPAIRVMMMMDQKCFEYPAKNGQTPLMTAITFGNGPLTKLILDSVDKEKYISQDQWGFDSLMHTMKNNYFTGFIYMLTKGYPLKESTRDMNNCGYIHWASFMDRRLALTILFRAGHDFMFIDKQGMSVFDRAVENWSLHTMNFICDYSQRPLKTMWLLRGNANHYEQDMLPPTKVKSYEIKSDYFRSKLLYKRHVREGVYNSWGSLFKHSFGYFIVPFIKHKWDKYNAKNKYWLKLYYVFIIYILTMSLILLDYSHSTYSFYLLLFILVSTSLAILSAMSFGNYNPIPQQIELLRERRIDKIEINDSRKYRPSFDDYYLDHRDYDDYLGMFGINTCMYQEIHNLFENEEWDKLKGLNDTLYCGICGIKRSKKVRHCPNVNICIPGYHMYSHYFDQPVYVLNQRRYLLFLIADWLFISLTYLSLFFTLGNRVAEKGILSLWFNMVYLHWINGSMMCCILSIIQGWAIIVKSFNIGVFIYCIVYGFTIDEQYNPQYYPYLFVPVQGKENVVKLERSSKTGMQNIKDFILNRVNVSSYFSK